MQRHMQNIGKRKPAAAQLLVALAVYLVLLCMISMSVTPEKYDLRVGMVSNLTITAPEDAVDQVSTGALMDAAERAVSPSYNEDETVMPEVVDALNSALGEVDTLPRLRHGMDGDLIESATPAMIEQARQKLGAIGPADARFSLTEDDIKALVDADELILESMTTDVAEAVRETLNGRLVDGQEDEAIEKIRRDMEDEDPAPLGAVLKIARAFLRPNMFFDEETTVANREKARAEVQPVIYMKGQNIVRAGEVITKPQIEMLDSLGLLKTRAIDIKLYLGIGLLILMLLVAVGTYLFTFEAAMLRDPLMIALIGVILIVVTGFSVMLRMINAYLMPVVLGALLTAVLLKPRLGIVINLVLSVLSALLASTRGSLFSSTTFAVMINSFISGTLCVILIRGRRQRVSVLVASLASIVTGSICIAAVELISGSNPAGMLTPIAYDAGGMVLSAILCVGLQPVFEWLFNMGTGTRLVDLSNPNQPLMRRLMIEAPGTYHHSMIVANMSEAAANAIGANGLLARVGSYYHDIGKLKRPLYFKENQINDNPHDRTDPRVSTAILTAHPRDGAEMALKARIPHAIREIIQQHHGDTPVLYFYDKASKQGGDVDIKDFRYDGPRPEKPEAAIVMLADTIEAAARSMTDSTPEKLSSLIQRLVRSKVDDGQLDHCSLTFKDLNLICEAFLTVLGGVFHDRIEYPTIDIPERSRIEQPEDKPDEKERVTEMPPEAEEKPDPEQSIEAETFLEELPTLDDTQLQEDES